MLTLALDTSGPVGSVALRRDGRLLGERTLDTQQQHSSLLLPTIDELFRTHQVTAQQVDLWSVGLGPGSYTGIRVGIAAVKGFALACGRPLVGASSMEALAIEHDHAGPVAVLSDARRGEIYFLISENRKPIVPLQLGSIEELSGLVTQPMLFIGPEIKRYETEISARLGALARFPQENLHPRANFVADLAEQRFAQQGKGDDRVEPIYLRETSFKKVAS